MQEHFLLQQSIMKGLNIALEPSAKILDFGCGQGKMVAFYQKQGFHHTYGYDILDYWDSTVSRDFFLDSDEMLAERAGQFDFIFSDQVFEHVRDYKKAVSQLHSLLAPGGVSLHIFPSKRVIIEPHIKVPFASWGQNRWYLLVWALMGVRNEFQKKSSVMDTWKVNVEFMKANVNYLPKKEIQEYFQSCFKEFYWAESLYVKHSSGRLNRLPSFVRNSSFVRWFIENFHVNVLVVRKGKEETGHKAK